MCLTSKTFFARLRTKSQLNRADRAFTLFIENIADMTSKKNVHVVPSPNGGWDVKQEGNKAPIAQCDTQQAAIDSAKPVAVINQSELVIHRQDGTIRDKDSYGNDPFPPKDRRP